MDIHLIWAQDENGGIGKNGLLPWHISEDLKNFKKITLNLPIIMGRKTWDSLPSKPLPNRRNIIFSTNIHDGLEVYQSIQECIKSLEKDHIDKVFIKGKKTLFTYKNLNKSKRGNIFQNDDDIDLTLSNIISNNDHLMVKGSNATGLNILSKKMIKGL